MVENQRTSRSATSRRTLLKTIGGTGIAATALSGTSTAATDAGFHCSVHFPSLFKDNEAPLDPDDVGAVQDQRQADGILAPDSAKGTDCGGYFDPCENYQVEIPFIISWKTDADPSDIGNVVASVDAHTPADTGKGAGSIGYSFSEQEKTITDEDGGLGLTATFEMQTGLSSKLFRPIHLDMELDFSDSNISVDAADDVLTKTTYWATPNKSQISVEISHYTVVFFRKHCSCPPVVDCGTVCGNATPPRIFLDIPFEPDEFIYISAILKTMK